MLQRFFFFCKDLEEIFFFALQKFFDFFLHKMDEKFLPDEIWLEIFSYLSISERIFDESVSKRWLKLFRSQWTIKKKLNLHSVLYADYANRPFIINRRDRRLESILKRCGPYLKSLKLAEVQNYRSVQSFTAKFEMTSRAMGLIGEYCRNSNIGAKNTNKCL